MPTTPKPSLADLARVLAKLDAPEAIESFLRDLLTPAEIQVLTERWAIVQMLASGQSQRAIALALDVSLTTVNRGNRQLRRGEGGFARALALGSEDPQARPKTKTRNRAAGRSD